VKYFIFDKNFMVKDFKLKLKTNMSIWSLIAGFLLISSVSSRPFSVSIFQTSGDLNCVLWYPSTESCTNSSVSWSKSSLTSPCLTTPICIDDEKYKQRVEIKNNGICRVALIVKNVDEGDVGIYNYEHQDSETNGLYGGLWHE
jgi:hypothetical protein